MTILTYFSMGVFVCITAFESIMGCNVQQRGGQGRGSESS